MNNVKQASSTITKAWVSFNNQNSILMSMRIPDKAGGPTETLCLLHDNRIFAFEKDINLDEQTKSSSSTEQNILLNLLTTPKYRAMGAMYLIFRLLDNLSFLAIIVLSILNHHPTIPSPSEMALFSTIGFEIFYDVMFQTNKYWILHRLSVYIALVLFSIYTIIVVLNYYAWQLEFVASVLALRFVAFVLEVCVDIAIDGELHNDLVELGAPQDTNGAGRLDVLLEWVLKFMKLDDYLDIKKMVLISPEEGVTQAGVTQVGVTQVGVTQVGVTQDGVTQAGVTQAGVTQDGVTQAGVTQAGVTQAEVTQAGVKQAGVRYLGSFFAWSPSSVFNPDIWGNEKSPEKSPEKFPRWLVLALCFIPGTVTLGLVVILAVVCLLAALIPFGIACLCYSCCACRPNTLQLKEYWAEVKNF